MALRPGSTSGNARRAGHFFTHVEQAESMARKVRSRIAASTAPPLSFADSEGRNSASRQPSMRSKHFRGFLICRSAPLTSNSTGNRATPLEGTSVHAGDTEHVTRLGCKGAYRRVNRDQPTQFERLPAESSRLRLRAARNGEASRYAHHTPLCRVPLERRARAIPSHCAQADGDPTSTRRRPPPHSRLERGEEPILPRVQLHSFVVAQGGPPQAYPRRNIIAGDHRSQSPIASLPCVVPSNLLHLQPRSVLRPHS